MAELRRLTAKAIRYARRLIEFDSSSFRSNRLIARYLELKLVKHGFVVERLKYVDRAGVSKYCLVAKLGTGSGGFAWCGHMDVVPAERWHSRRYGPFEPVILRGRLYGRGSCDMKGPLACFLAAAACFSRVRLQAPLYAILTADEETGFAGIRCVVEESSTFREMVESRVPCVVGEPTGLEVIHAHKGSVQVAIRATGTAGHSSNTGTQSAIWPLIPALTFLSALREETELDPQWQCREFSPPHLSMNLKVRDNAAALNMTASEAVAEAYFRTMPGVRIDRLLERIHTFARSRGLRSEVIRQFPPMSTSPESDFVRAALQQAGHARSRTAGFGTDASLLSELPEVVICGPGSVEQAHTDHEYITVEQIRLGADLYRRMIATWCRAQPAG